MAPLPFNLILTELLLLSPLYAKEWGITQYIFLSSMGAEIITFLPKKASTSFLFSFYGRPTNIYIYFYISSVQRELHQ